MVIKRIHFTIPLPPVTKKNHPQVINRSVNGKTVPMVIPSKQYRQYEKDAGVFIRPRNANINYPVNVKALYYMPTRRRVDLVNLHSALHDVLVHYAVVEDDNCRIIASTDGSRVLYDKENPRTEVWIEAVEEERE